jgi:Predicted membrane protein
VTGTHPARRSPEPDVGAVLVFPSRRELVRRFPPLLAGIALISLGISVSVRAHLGLAPWDVFHQGVSKRTGISLGWVIVGVGAVVLLTWFPLRQRFGIGTIVNAVLVGTLVKVSLPYIGAPDLMVARIAMLLGAIAAFGIGGGLYIGAGLGPGPRDGIMTAITARGHRLWVVRTVLELSVLVVGWLLGGNIGVGTPLIALSLGPVTHFAIHRFHLPVPATSVEVMGE